MLLALLSAVALTSMMLVGLWEQSLQTLALMGASVVLALLVGLPMGVLLARGRGVDAASRPILDAMQTMPAFVYLIPVLLFFGVACVPAVVATAVHALPPAIRFTASGIAKSRLRQWKRQTCLAQQLSKVVEGAIAFGVARGAGRSQPDDH